MSEEEVDAPNRNPIDILPDTYARRKRSARGRADPLRYDEVPHKVRMQVLHILSDAIDLDRATVRDSDDKTFEALIKFFRRELGVGKLSSGYHPNQEFTQWFLATTDLEQVVSAIEMIGRIITFMARRSAYQDKRPPLRALVTEINARLLEEGIGYQFESGAVIEADSRYLHTEVVVPALELLADDKYQAANSEFLAAHEAFRERDYEQCLVECCKSFESVIKVISAERGWGTAPNAPAKALVKSVFDNELIPAYLETEFAGIRTVLENGIGTVRNKAGGHGAGTERREVPRHLAAFQLHQTGAAITLLAEAHASQPS